MVSSPQDAYSLIRTLNSLSEETDLGKSETARKTALNVARKLVATLNDPVNTALETILSPYIATSARIAVDLGLFYLIERNDGNEPLSTETLSNRSGGEPLLINRILRLLASVGFVAEVGRDRWAATPITKAMASSPMTSGYRFVWDVLMTSAVKAPQYLREIGHVSPTQPSDGFIQYAHQTKYNVFEYLAKVQPERLYDFNNFMGNTMGARNYWVDWFPVEKELLDGYHEDTKLLVDVAGGKGHDIRAFQNRYPKASNGSRLVLQDLSQALDGIEAAGWDEAIERQVQDFFTPNQVRGARAYFLHHIIHDWSDEYALKILAQLRDAMTPGYSKLLIHELVLPDEGATTFQTIFDMTMMTFNGGMERSRSQWSDLLVRAGFKVVDFWYGPDGADADGLIEAILDG